MRYVLWTIIGIIAFIGIFTFGFHWDGEKASLIAELPNTAEYAIDGRSVDIGIIYKGVGISFLKGAININVYNYDKRWCLLSGKTFWVHDKENLDKIAQSAGISLPSKLSLPFWDEWGGRLIVITFIFIFVIFVKFQPKLKVLKPFNPNLSKLNAANLIFNENYKIKRYNGTDVRWSVFSAKFASILLPPGECSLVFDHSKLVGGTRYNAQNHTVKNTVEAGKTYFLKSVGTDTLYTDIVEGKEEEIMR